MIDDDGEGRGGCCGKRREASWMRVSRSQARKRARRSLRVRARVARSCFQNILAPHSPAHHGRPWIYLLICEQETRAATITFQTLRANRRTDCVHSTSSLRNFSENHGEMPRYENPQLRCAARPDPAHGSPSRQRIRESESESESDNHSGPRTPFCISSAGAGRRF